MSKIAMRDLLDAGVHFGHQTGRWNPKMAPYIYGSRNGVHIIDLSKTVRQFDRAYDFVTGVVSQGRSVLFIGTKKQAQVILQEESARAKQFHITNRWLGGTLTNFRTIKTGIERLKELDRMSGDGSFEKFTKKEAFRVSVSALSSTSAASRTCPAFPAWRSSSTPATRLSPSKSATAAASR